MQRIRSILDRAAEMLQGEPLRAIGYGGGVLLYIVARIFGQIPDVPLDQAILQVSGIAAVFAGFVETARRFVYSAPTVQRIADEAAFTGSPSIEPPPADKALL